MKALSEVRLIPACKLSCLQSLQPRLSAPRKAGVTGWWGARGGDWGVRGEGGRIAPRDSGEGAGQSERAPPAANHRPPRPANLPRSAGRGCRESGRRVTLLSGFGKHRAGSVCPERGTEAGAAPEPAGGAPGA